MNLVNLDRAIQEVAVPPVHATFLSNTTAITVAENMKRCSQLTCDL